MASLQRPPLPAASSSASFNESLEDPTKSLQLTLGSSKPLLSTGLSLKSSLDLECAARPEEPVSNQIYLVPLRPTQLTQASFLQKNQMLQNVFLISVTLRWHRVACKNMSL